MPRSYLPAELTLLAGDHNSHAKVEVRDHLGTWQDVSAYFVDARWSRTIDAPVMTGTVTFLRRLGALSTSIAPLIGAGTLNNIGGVFAPLVDGSRAIRLSTATTFVGGAPTTWREVFVGRIDNPDWGGDENTHVVAISDNGAWLMSKIIDTERDYGSDAGVPVETVMQQILDDNVTTALGAVTLALPDGSPSWNIHKYTQAKGPVLDALRQLAQQIGWDVRFQYDSANAFRLMFLLPDRAKTTSDLTITPSQYYAVTQFSTNTDDVRTRGMVAFVDHATGATLQATASASAGAIAQHGDRYIEISEDASSNIDTMTEAQAMIDAIISDLSDAYASQVIELDYFPLAELGDLYTFTANSEHYDSDQKLAVVGISHTLSAQGDATSLTCRGRVAGAYKSWLLQHGTATGGTAGTSDTLYLENWRIVDRDETSVTYGWDATPGVAEIWVYDKTTGLPFYVEPWPSKTAPPDPDYKLAPGPGTLKLDFPPEQNARFVQLDTRSAAGVAGHQYRVVLYPTGAAPSFGKITQVTGASGLFAAIRVDIFDPQNLGGTLEAWVNRNSPSDPDPTLPADGTLAVASTPHTATPSELFTLYGGTTPSVLLLSNIQVHPGRGKRVFFRFTNSKGTPSEIASYQILSEGPIIDANGDLLPGTIKDALAFASTIQPVQVYTSTLPSTGANGTFAFLTSTGKIYRRVSGAWVATVDGGDIVANTVTAGAFAAGAVTASAIHANAVAAYHLNIAVISDIAGGDLGIIVAGRLTSISGAVTLNLNATGSGRVFDSSGFWIDALGNATFAGVVASTTFSGSFAQFRGGISVGTFIGGNIDFYAAPTPPFSGIFLGGSIGGGYDASYGAGVVVSGALYAGNVKGSTADFASLMLGGYPASFGAANSGGSGYRAIVVPN